LPNYAPRAEEVSPETLQPKDLVRSFRNLLGGGRKRARTKAARDGNEYLRPVVEPARDAFVAIDSRGRIIEWSPQAEKTFGWSREEILGRTLAETIIPPARRAAHHKGLAPSFAAGEGPVFNQRLEFTALDRNGNELPVELTIWPAHTRQGWVSYAFLRDIRESKRSERLLRESEALFRTMVSTLEDYSIMLLDPSGQVVTWNTGVERLKGYRAEEIIGRHISCVYPPEDIERGKPETVLQAVAREGRYEEEAWRVRKDGSRFWANVLILAARDEAGQLYGYVEQVSDISERKRTELALRESTERLRTLSRRLLEVQETERRALARELHDEIGQALSALKINFQGMLRLTEPSAQARYLEDSVEIVEHTLQQVRSLSLDLRPSLLDDLGLVPALRWYLDNQAQRAGFAARLVADPLETRLPSHLETACFRVVQEAITNIVRHARAPRVDVELRHADSELRLTIRDDGLGFNVRAAQAHAARGNSLGLISMQERVHLAGGTMDIESTVGQGTQIRARFPLAGMMPDA
jgi:PAS domain S-box-containing protein